VPDEPTRALRRWIAPALGTGLAYLLNYRLIQDEGATTASTVTYLLPIVAVILGAIVLSEPITWNLFAGTAIVLAGVAASDQRVAARMRPSTPNQSPTLRVTRRSRKPTSREQRVAPAR
jgi:EamA-like transporter family